MKILTVVYSLGKGGTERAAQNFAEAYMLGRHDSRVLVTRDDGLRADDLRSVGVPVIHLKEKNAIGVIKIWSPDVVHLHSHGLNEEGVELILEALPNARFVETNVFSNVTPWQARLHCSFQLSKWCMWLHFIRTRGSVPSTEIPYPVRTISMSRASEPEIEKFRTDHGMKVNDIVIGRIGQAFSGKWSWHLIDLFNRLRAEDSRYKLLVVNPPQCIIDEIERSPYQGDISIIDQIIGDQNLALAYSSIDVFVLIAEQGESFGMVVAESLLCQTTVVTLATPWDDNSQGEVVGHEIGGIVANTPRDIQKAIRLLANDSQKRIEYGTRGRERIIKHYDYRHVAAKALVAIDAGHFLTKVKPPVSLYYDTCSRVGLISRILIRFYSARRLFRYINNYLPWRHLCKLGWAKTLLSRLSTHK